MKKAFLTSLPIILCALLSVLTMGVKVHADTLSSTLDGILNAPEMNGALTGAVVQRVSDRQVFYTHDCDLRLMPASNRKLFTSALALETLGADRRFTTEIRTIGNPDKFGTLRAGIYIRGGGDSMLTASDIDQLADQVVHLGIKKIIGPIVGDGSAFPDGPYPIGWSWDYLSDDYAPQISGLEVNRGIVAVHVAAGASPGFPTRVTLDPPAPFVTLINHATTIKAKTSDCLIQRVWDRNTIVIDGTVAAGSFVDNTVTVADPADYAATVFAACLKRHGVTMLGSIQSGETPKNATQVLATHSSPTVGATLSAMNKPSDNLLAESLMRQVGLTLKQSGTYDAGHSEEDEFLKPFGIDPQTLSLADACGVSRLDYVTARSVSLLLLGMHEKSDWKLWYDSLPIAGVDGTLRRRMIGTIAQGNVHAKTGSMHNVSCLSGYVTAKNGDLYAFSLLMNNFSGEAPAIRSIQDHFVETLAATL